MAQIDRERVGRTLTFWLRPAFALRVVGCFQRIAGFDRSMALASSMLTATVPLAILGGAALSWGGDEDAADHIISRYGLTGDAADAVRQLLSVPPDVGVGVFGAVFLVISTLSFARAAQRLFEQTWQLKPLSVRNTLNDLKWAVGFVVCALVDGWLLGAVGQGRHLLLWAYLLGASVTGAFLVWGGRVLSANRIAWRDLVPFGIIAAVLTAVYSAGAAFYVPRLFDAYASRYGAIGVVFAMLSAFFGVVLVVVGAAVLGREVDDELDRIRRGERPADDEVRREWDTVIAQARERWQTARGQISRIRSSRKSKHP
ncbi:YihY/virulence factor BrkB family protein [Kitasatospora sp. NBC_00374]|uniref:YhjD/YihY/BrkB family envelope integrity protein n=1 Tax=Kitasatospora sp. NBC_00374 TaxID=2975964 RepID=UPI003247C593